MVPRIVEPSKKAKRNTDAGCGPPTARPGAEAASAASRLGDAIHRAAARSRGTRSEEGVGHGSGARDDGLGLGGGGGLR